jgi:uncharacterized protein (DUF302 family)
MLKKIALFVSVAVAAALHGGAAAWADTDGIVTVPSNNSVTATADKLASLLTSKGITVFARVDHAAGAKKVGKSLRPTHLIIFGNPKLGTPLMESNQKIGLDLPMKALIYQASDNKTYISYTSPAFLAKRHGIQDRDKVFAKMTGALKNFTTAAAK